MDRLYSPFFTFAFPQYPTFNSCDFFPMPTKESLVFLVIVISRLSDPGWRIVTVFRSSLTAIISPYNTGLSGPLLLDFPLALPSIIVRKRGRYFIWVNLWIKRSNDFNNWRSNRNRKVEVYMAKLDSLPFRIFSGRSLCRFRRRILHSSIRPRCTQSPCHTVYRSHRGFPTASIRPRSN